MKEGFGGTQASSGLTVLHSLYRSGGCCPNLSPTITPTSIRPTTSVQRWNEAHNAGLKVAVHVFGGKAADNVIDGGADSIEHGFDLTDDQLRRMKEKNMYLVGTDFPLEHMIAFGSMTSLNANTAAEMDIHRLSAATGSV